MSEIRVDTISEKTSANGVAIDGLTIKDGGITATTGAIVFNEAGADLDFRVESDGNANMLFVDGGNDRVHINGSTGTRELNVSGNNTRIGIYSTNNSTGAGQLQFGDADNEQIGRILYEHDGNQMSFYTNNVQRLLIDSTGFFDVASTGNDIARFSGPNSGGLTIRNATANEVIIHTATSDALIVGTAGNNERFRVTDAGIHIGGTGAANAFDDYEEGTWTPTNLNGSNAVATTHKAIYVKIGNIVHVFCDITYASSPADTSQANALSGIPFSCSDDYFMCGSKFAGVNESVQANVASTSAVFRNMDDGVLMTRSQLASNRAQHYFTYTIS